jgi:hypothetical protein
VAYHLTWLPRVLRAAGLTCLEIPGWQTRGHGDMGPVKFVLCHHTAEPIDSNLEPDLQELINGRPDLAGPNANLGLGQNGKYYMIAAGKAWHAGPGVWHGFTMGNTQSIGIEAENNGLGEPWPAVQMDAYARGVAAILKHLGAGPEMCAGHKEFALPKGRKIDPSFSMPDFRKTVAGFMK